MSLVASLSPGCAFCLSPPASGSVPIDVTSSGFRLTQLRWRVQSIYSIFSCTSVFFSLPWFFSVWIKWFHSIFLPILLIVDDIQSDFFSSIFRFLAIRDNNINYHQTIFLPIFFPSFVKFNKIHANMLEWILPNPFFFLLIRAAQTSDYFKLT